MNREEIDNVARLPPPPRGSSFIGSEIDWMKYITEIFVRNCGEESEIAVRNPFELCRFIGTIQEGGVNQGLAAMPLERKSIGLKQRAIQFGSLQDTLLTVMENIDIT